MCFKIFFRRLGAFKTFRARHHAAQVLLFRKEMEHPWRLALGFAWVLLVFFSFTAKQAAMTQAARGYVHLLRFAIV